MSRKVKKNRLSMHRFTASPKRKCNKQPFTHSILHTTVYYNSQTSPSNNDTVYRPHVRDEKVRIDVYSYTYTQTIVHVSLHNNLSSPRAQIQRYLKVKYTTNNSLPPLHIMHIQLSLSDTVY